jgi:hypothetical protein
MRLVSIPLLALIGCGDTVTHIHHHYDVDPTPGGEAPPEPPVAATTTPDALRLDLLHEDNNLFWIGVSPETLDALNAAYTDGGGGFPEGNGVYDPDGGPSGLSTETLLVMNPEGDIADFGLVDVKLVGQSTGSAWTSATIPNFRLDSDDFVEGQTFGGVEHIRLNNAQVGSMFGEVSALEIFRGLGVPAARATYVWVGGTGWEDGELLVPMIAREVYKGDFCEENAALLGGGCVSIREGVGDINYAGAAINFECDYGDCDDTTTFDALAELINVSYGSQDFDESTAAYLDWDAFMRSSCAHWLLWVGDDYVHNTNNVVIVEGEDGLFRFLPYSTDINAGYAWGGAYSETPLWGFASLSDGCRLDESCREAMYDTCEEVIDALEALDGVSLIHDLADRLLSAAAPWGDHPEGMWRGPDVSAYAHYLKFHEDRVEDARAELAIYREGGWDSGGWDTGGGGDTGGHDTGVEERGSVANTVGLSAP